MATALYASSRSNAGPVIRLGTPMLVLLHSTQRTSARDRGTDIGMGVDAENTRRVGSTVTIAAAKMVVIVVSRLLLTLRKERKKKGEERKGKDRTAGEWSRHNNA